MYRVIVPFFDLKDGGYAYHAGDAYPRAGKEAGEARIQALLTCANRRKMPLIEAVRDGRPGDSGNAESKPRKTKQRK